MRRLFVKTLCVLSIFCLYTTQTCASVTCIKYIDDLYDAAKITLRITVSKGDDFVHFIRATPKVEQLAKAISTLPRLKIKDTVLEVAVIRGKIKPTEILRIKGLMAKVDDGEKILLKAFSKGDDLLKVATRASMKAKAEFLGKVGEIGNSRILRANMKACGIVEPSYVNQAHHIVAGADKAAGPSRAILAKFGIGINGGANGVFLPEQAIKGAGVVHKGSHSIKYHQWVYDNLQHATSRDEVLDILQMLGEKLGTGNVPSGVW